MIAGTSLPRAGAAGRFPGSRLPANDMPPSEIPLPTPAIEDLPEYIGAIDRRRLSKGARHYNGSIAAVGKRLFMAYRFETYSARSHIGLCELDQDFRVIRNVTLELEDDAAAHAEDPHMACVGGSLHLFYAHVILAIPPICQQRLVVIDHETLTVASRERVSIGDFRSIEKNWQPFEDERGGLSVVYQQNPRMIVSIPEKELRMANLPPMAPEGPGVCDRPGQQRRVSGRTPPIRIGDEYIEFVGGHVPDFYRNARYWFSVLCFEAKAPYRITRFMANPLVWGSEASETIHSPRPNAGHPVCIFPSGAIKEGGSIIVSCGVNDSYIALMRYDLGDLLSRMIKIPA